MANLTKQLKSQPGVGTGMGAGTSDLAARIIQRNGFFESKRTQWMIRWDDCARYIQPRKGNILTRNTPGQQQTILLYDTTAEEALGVFGAGLVSNLVPAGERWFRFEPRSKDAAPAFSTWLDECSEIVAKEIGESNFYEGIHEDFLDAGCFGCSVLYLEEGTKDALLNFVNIPVGTFSYDENAAGRVDTVYRKWKWTARQAEQSFGYENLGDNVRKALDSDSVSEQDNEFTFIHAVYPRKGGEIIQGPTVAQNRPWASVYVCVEDKKVVREDGMYENPMAACRLLKSNNEVYGRGPGVQCMPEIKTVNRMEQDLLTAVEKLVNPPWLQPDDSSYRPDNRPNGVTYYDAAQAGVNNKPEQLQLRNNVDLGEKKTEQKRMRIRKAFYNDMFQMLTNLEEQKRQKTAYEVSQMVAEQLTLFSPMFGRLTQEKLNPLLHRTFGICFRAGRLPPPPMGVDVSGGYEVVYVSKIALAIKAVQNQALAAAVQIIQTLTPLDPSCAFLLKGRDAGRQVLRNVGVPAAWMRDDGEIDDLVKAQQQKQSQLEAAQGALAASQAVKNLGPTVQRKVSENVTQPQAQAA